jgi:adenine/guanine phosphoribosyltransferase-like PRPP-binding protein
MIRGQCYDSFNPDGISDRQHLARVLLVDDWVESGSEATAARQLVERLGGVWLGMSVLLDGLPDGPARHAIEPIYSLRRTVGLHWPC